MVSRLAVFPCPLLNFHSFDEDAVRALKSFPRQNAGVDKIVPELARPARWDAWIYSSRLMSVVKHNPVFTRHADFPLHRLIQGGLVVLLEKQHSARANNLGRLALQTASRPTVHWHAAGNASAAATAAASGVARNGGCYGADSGPSESEPRRPGIRPVEASKAAAC